MQIAKTDNPSTEKDSLSPVEAIRFEMSGKVKALATPCEPGESIKSCVRRVAARTGLTFGQVRRLWYSEWNVIPAHVADKIRAAVITHERHVDNQLKAMRARQAHLYARIHHAGDTDFCSVRAAEGDGDASLGG